MIAYEDFARLRLSHFLQALPVTRDPSDPAGARRLSGHEIAVLDRWKFMGATWVGEAIGFTEWLRLKSDPDVLRSVAVDLAELPKSVSSRSTAARKFMTGLRAAESKVPSPGPRVQVPP